MLKLAKWVISGLITSAILMVIGAWDYVTMRSNEDTRFD